MKFQVGLGFTLILGVLGASMNEPVLNEEVVTESVTSAPEVAFRDKGDFIIRYPVTPEPDETATPTEAPPADIDVVVPRMTEQAFITGQAECTCGQPKTKIVGGEDSSINDLPWTVALIRRRNGTLSKGPYCGGTLICDRYIATASHCVDGFTADGIQVWLYEENFMTDDENPQPTIKIDVQDIIMHPEYNSRKIDNDIALLRLVEPVNITNSGSEASDSVVLTPACLPADDTNTFEGEDATVAGWGATEMGGDVSPTLKKVVVPVITNKQCNWRTLYLGKITDNMLCAGNIKTGEKDSCQGDSGGPLVIPRGSRYILAGIVSFGYGCAQPYAPGVYTRVSKYPEWIQQNTQDCQYCKS